MVYVLKVLQEYLEIYIRKQVLMNFPVPVFVLEHKQFIITFCHNRIIRQNLVIALGVIGLLLIASGIGVIPLSVAVVLHEGSTIVVVLNALRLLATHQEDFAI